jgi:hypothetical protein
MNRSKGPNPPSQTLWLPSADSFGLDAPNSSQLWHVWDKKQFFRLGKHRQVYIRHEILNEFPSGGIHALPLLVLVIKLSDWHLRIPIWRGPTFFTADLHSDAAVMMTVTECISRRWCDRDAISGPCEVRNEQANRERC